MRVSILISALVAMLSAASTTSAQQLPESDPATPVSTTSTGGTGETRYTMRGLTLPEGTISIIGGPASNLDLSGYLLDGGVNVLVFKDVEVCFLNNCGVVEVDDPAFMWIGGSIGVVPNLEIGALLLPLQLSPDFDYGDLGMYGKYRFVEGDIDVAGQVLVFLPTDSSDATIDLGVPVRFRGSVRVETGGYLQIDTGGDVGMRIPATITTNVTEALYLGGRTGLHVPDFDFDNGYIPLELLLGYTIPGPSGPAADLSLMAGFPFFLTFGGRSEYDELVTEIFHIGLGVNGYFDAF